MGVEIVNCDEQNCIHEQDDSAGRSVHDEDAIDEASPALSETSFTFPPLSSSSNDPTHGNCHAERSKVEDIIFRMSRLSNSSWQSGSQYRDVKAESFIDRDEAGNDLTSSFSKLAVLVVNHRFPHADETIRHRLAESMARRRNSIAYRRSRREQLPNVQQMAQVSPTPATSGLRPENQGKIVTHGEQTQEQLPTMIIDQAAVPSATSAPTIDLERIRVPDNATSLKASTVHSETQTQSSTSGFPRAPKMDKNEVFDCPYCCIRCLAREARGKYWR